MADVTQPARRTILTLGATGAFGGALVLAGCSPSSPSASNTARPSTSSTPEVTNEPPVESAGPDQPATGEDIAALADVPVGGSIDATIDGAPALVSQPTEGAVVAFSAICTHQGCIVAAAGAEFDCPCHGSRYDAATGEVLSGPAIDPLAPIAVAVSGDRIVAAS
ncbi:Ferredoxin subunit of nitrite reductase or a ring-hydroxylating dioxygenase [Agromyces sp. CF514]|uniref:QcrA and Rieske domain-containing protein n=1 Tax=Agromyces sp. CF514 TaxID=1881031 RepID=UPI0008F09849|nr:Rieske (2Fe-2S) protein [Agromyces sp. CF514]SFR76310.1 Ferredoxin subunit of nitrite reductase or a ring-hydroxylating dioxygenase [Agromyces sp. CF514]